MKEQIIEIIWHGIERERAESMADEVLKLFTQPEPEQIKPTLADVLMSVSQKTKIPYADMFLKTRRREIVEARQIYFKRAKEMTNETFQRIGEFVNKDHATVMYGIDQVNDVKELSARYNSYFHPKPVIIAPVVTKGIAKEPAEPIQREPYRKFEHQYGNVPVPSGEFKGYSLHT
jgi:hypothetical protein